MRIAIPVTDGQVSQHFGHCHQFIFFEVDQEKQVIISRESIAPPPHEPGVLPAWIAERGADVVIAGGMGQRAQQMLVRSGAEVVAGVPPSDPVSVVEQYLAGTIQPDENPCDHGDAHGQPDQKRHCASSHASASRTDAAELVHKAFKTRGTATAKVPEEVSN